MREEEDSDFCSIASDMLLFFRIGFFLDGEFIKEFDLLMSVLLQRSESDRLLLFPGKRGP